MHFRSSFVLISLAFTLFLSAAHAEKVRPGIVLYKLNSEAHPSELKSLNGLLHSNGLLEEKVINNLGLRVAKFDAVGRELAISKILMASGAVQFAEPDYEVAPTLMPNDPLYSNQWHHETINTPTAWDQVTGDVNVLVAVCDTGVDTDHPDLVNNLVLPGYNAADGTNNVEDVHGHGSGTIGSLAAVGNNGLGVSGVAWDLSVLPVKINISDQNSSAYISTMATCIAWSADQGAKVVNLSYGGIQYASIDNAATYLRNKGGLLFMSAGNEGLLHSTGSVNGKTVEGYPDYRSFIAVGATDQNNVKASFSNWGDYIDLVAPGVSIATTYKDAGYVYYSGTSFSSPIAAGVAALLYAVKPDITPIEVENALFDSAVSVGDSLLYGHGLVNASDAVNIVLNLEPTNIKPTAVFTESVIAGDVPLDVLFDASLSSDADGDIVSYAWSFGDGSSATGSVVQHTYNSGGDFTATLIVTDNSGAVDQSSVVIKVNDPTVLNGPSNLSASVSGRTISLNWQNNSTSEDGFYIERAHKKRGRIVYQRVATTSASSTQFADVLTNKGTYFYRVQSFRQAELSEYSNSVSVRLR